MNKIENYLGIANHDIQVANNSQELKSYVASILCENDELQQEKQKYKEVIDKLSSQIKLYGKYNGEKCTRGFSMMIADFNKLLDILKEVSE